MYSGLRHEYRQRAPAHEQYCAHESALRQHHHLHAYAWTQAAFELIRHFSAREEAPALGRTATCLVVVASNPRHVAWPGRREGKNRSPRRAAGDSRGAGVFCHSAEILNDVKASISKIEQTCNLDHYTLVHIASRHQQLIDAVAVEIRLAHDSILKIDVRIANKL